MELMNFDNNSNIEESNKNIFMMIFLLCFLAMPSCSKIPTQAMASSELSFNGLSFDYYREVVEPILLRPRGGFVGSETSCISCHAEQSTTPMPLLQPLLDEDRRPYWTEDQARVNFESVARLVNVASPTESRLLMAPLSPAQGGRRHSGGVFWDSNQNSEYRFIEEWARSGDVSGALAPNTVQVDFEFFRSCVQPLFFSPIENALPCASCHGGEFAVSPAAGRSYWTGEESQLAFEEFSYLYEPGYPEYSRFMGKLLHPNAGGDLMHNGGRRWLTQDDPERVALAEWIRGKSVGSDCPAPLQFDPDFDFH